MKKVLSIEGMSCSHCVAHVKSALEGVDGVKKAEVDLAGKRALVEGVGLSEAALRSAVDEAGYSVAAIADGI